LLVILPPGLLARVVRSFSKNENVFSKRARAGVSEMTECGFLKILRALFGGKMDEILYAKYV